LRKAVRQIMKQPLKLGIACRRNPAHGSARESIPRQHNPVESIAAQDRTSRAVYNRRRGRVVECRIEFGYVIPQAMPGWPQRVSNTELESEVFPDLPTVLHEHVSSQRTPGRIGLPADFGIVREKAHSHIGDSRARTARA